MKSFEFINAQSAESARELVREKNGKFLAGGIDLLGEMKDYLTQPDRVVNVKTIPDLTGFTLLEDKAVIGANTRLVDLMTDDVHQAFPGLSEATSEVGSPQIRNVATVGGNLAQHSRCWYYRHKDVQCLKNDGTRCYASDGESKYHSIFTGNPCISPVVSNLAVIFTALDARVKIQARRGVESWDMEKLYEKAWDNPFAHNSLSEGDLILHIELPRTMRRKSAYMQISEKSDFDWALVSCAAAADVENGKLQNPRLAMGAISNVPYRVEEVDSYLSGKTLDDAVAQEAAERLLEGAETTQHNAYKVPMAKALVKRTLLKLLA